MVSKNLKTGVFVDASNVFKNSNKRDLNGNLVNYHLKWSKVKEWLDEVYSPIIFRYFCYEDDNPSNAEFLIKYKGEKRHQRDLEKMGIEVIRGSLAHIPAENRTQGNMDDAIIANLEDCLNKNEIDRAIIFSGDEDFLPIIKKYVEIKKIIRVVSFEKKEINGIIRKFMAEVKTRRCRYILLNNFRSQLEEPYPLDKVIRKKI